LEKNYEKLSIHVLIILAIIFLAVISLQASFAVNVNNSTASGGINQGLNSATNGETILLAEGNYTGANNTGLTINKNVTIQGNGPKDKIIIDAKGLNRIFTINNNLNVTFINITFINGYSGTANRGAILNNYQATQMTIMNCIFFNNTGVNGGAISNIGARMNISNTIFNNNASQRGGAIICGGDAKDVSISNCSFSNNIAYISGNGGWCNLQL